MYRALQTFLVALCLLVSCLATGLRAQEDIRPLVDALGATAFPQKIEAVKALAASGNPKTGEILQNLSDGKLYAPRTGGRVFLEGPSDGTYLDVLTGVAAAGVPGNLAKIRLNNGLRGAIGAALSQLTLLSPERSARLAAAQDLLKSADPDNLALLNSALSQEQDAEVKATMEAARAVILLKTDASAADKKSAIDTIAARGNRDALTILTAAMATAPDDLKPAIDAHIDTINRSLAAWDVAQNVWYGLSLGSVLLLAAIGLAITFGVMGIINMAHGEMVMLGAYTTYVVQQTVAAVAPRHDRLFAGFCRSRRISVYRPGRGRHRAQRHPLALRPAARNAARHLGYFADPAAGDPHHFRPDKPAGGQSQLDVRRL